MEDKTSDSIEKIHQQFDTSPYPRMPLDYYPDDIKFLYLHSLVTPYYLRNQKVIETEGKVILDAGCGSGYKALALAVANPGATIIGIDISEASVKLARQRFEYHGLKQAEFYVLSLEDLPKLGREFDYINNDEVLYLLPAPASGLRAMKSVLKPDGIIRTNLHSLLQRAKFFRAQEVFKMMGLMDENPQELEIELVREIMKALKDQVVLKATTWRTEFDRSEERILMNYLFQGDRGYTIPQMFSALRAADLELICMVQWQTWDLMDLFKTPDNLPMFLGISLPNLSVEERLHLFDLLHPVHRLLDFWCTHPNTANPLVPVAEWTIADWQGVQVHLHPLLKRTEKVTQELVASVANIKIVELGKYLPFAKNPNFVIDSTAAACILPLLEGPQPIKVLVDRWKQLKSVNPLTLQPTSDEETFDTVKQLLTTLESVGYVLLER